MFYEILQIAGLQRVADKTKSIINSVKSELNNEISRLSSTVDYLDTKLNTLESGLDWKESVDTFDELDVVYPQPQNGWTVNVKDTNYTYRYNGTTWVVISANAIPNATEQVRGLMTTAQVAKLNQLENYVLPIADTETLGGIKPDGETLVINGEGVARAIGEVKELDTLRDTSIINPSNGQILKYDSALGKWVNGESDGMKLEDVSGANITIQTGETTASIVWTDPTDIIIDGITLAEWAGTKVIRKMNSAPETETDGTLVIDSTTRNQYSSTALEDTGLVYGQIYYYRFFPYTTNGLYTAGTSISITPEKIAVAIPSQVGTLVYNGSEQSPSWSSSTGYTASGQLTGTNAGTYTMIATLGSQYKWTDGTDESKNINWQINKKTELVTLSSDSATLDLDHLTASVTVSNLLSREITSVVSADTTIATATFANNEVTIAHVNETSGNTIVTVNVGASTNYNATTATIYVTAYFPTTDLNDYSWAEIQAAAQDGTASSLWNVGDRKAVTLSGTVGLKTFNSTYYVYILGFNHNSSIEGDNTIHFQFGFDALSDGNHIAFCDSAYNSGYGSQGFVMNVAESWETSSNIGGWQYSHMRLNIMQPLYNILPSDLRNVIMSVNKYTDNGTDHTIAESVTVTSDLLFLLAEYEVFGRGSRSTNTYEKDYQAQYSYYALGNSKTFKKDTDPESTSVATYWHRSPSTIEGCYIIDSSSGNSGYAGMSRGIAPAFVVG